MNHKRKRPKNARAGCLMCKPWKVNGANPMNARMDTNRQLIRIHEQARQEKQEVGL